MPEWGLLVISELRLNIGMASCLSPGLTSTTGSWSKQGNNTENPDRSDGSYLSKGCYEDLPWAPISKPILV